MVREPTASQAWFIGATPSQYALSVALFTNNPGTQVLNNLPSINGMPGSQGGGWPAAIWNNFMTAQFSNTPAIPLFTPENGFPFVTWIQAKAKHAGPPACKMGQFTGCKCPKHCWLLPESEPESVVSAGPVRPAVQRHDAVAVAVVRVPRPGLQFAEPDAVTLALADVYADVRAAVSLCQAWRGQAECHG